MAGSVNSPAEAFTRMTFGFRDTQALYVVAKLGVADHLVGGPLGAIDLAKKLGVKPRPLFRVMRALASQGVFTQDRSDRFGLAPIGRLLLSDSPESLRYMAISTGEETYKAAGELLHTVRTGETAFDHIYGKGHFDYLAEHEEESRTFNLFMTQSLRRFGSPLAAYDFKGRSTVVDVGGGRGTLLAQVLRANPRLKGVLFDLPHGVAEAPQCLEAEGVAGRCRIVKGDFFRSVPEGGDVYVLSRILHDWPDEKAAKILANCRKAIKDGGVLVIREAVVPTGDAPAFSKQVDLTMLYLLGGMERTEEEWRKLLRSSRFELKRIIKTGQPFDLIEATPS
ncbi:MAG: methyltransferase [Thaumarchaeota archaeon]|nr:methyltransferase [Nitrososphaerota archaeon]